MHLHTSQSAMPLIRHTVCSTPRVTPLQTVCLCCSPAAPRSCTHVSLQPLELIHLRLQHVTTACFLVLHLTCAPFYVALTWKSEYEEGSRSTSSLGATGRHIQCLEETTCCMFGSLMVSENRTKTKPNSAPQQPEGPPPPMPNANPSVPVSPFMIVKAGAAAV